MFVEPHIPRHADLPATSRELTALEAISFFHDVAMGRKRIEEVEGISGRKDPDGTYEHLIRFHQPIRIVHRNGATQAMAVLVTKDPKGHVSIWWYDDANEAEMEWNNDPGDDE
jgi:hypothetical protein